MRSDSPPPVPLPAAKASRSPLQWAIFLIVALLFLGAPGYLIYSDFFQHDSHERDAISGPPKIVIKPGATQPASQPSWRSLPPRTMQPRRQPPPGGFANQPPLLRALQMGNYDSALNLIDGGADVNMVSADPRQTTPLIEACGRQEDEAFDVVQVLLGKGADVNRAQSAGLTPLMRAARAGSPLTLGALLSHGANVNAVSRRGETALDLAMQGGQAEVIAALQKAGGKPGSVIAPPRPAKPASRPVTTRPATRPTTRKATTRPTTKRATTRPATLPMSVPGSF